jgi:hypothetical protein
MIFSLKFQYICHERVSDGIVRLCFAGMGAPVYVESLRGSPALFAATPTPEISRHRRSCLCVVCALAEDL